MGAFIASAAVSRVEVVESGRRRRWTEDEKLRIVGESLNGTRLVSATARRYGISRWLLSTWRRQFRVRAQSAAESPPGLVPAVVVSELSTVPGTVAPPPPSEAPAPLSRRIEIVVANGRRLIVDIGVDEAALVRVLHVLERR
jgi:transposase